MPALRGVVASLATGLLLAGPARATTVVFSDASSDATPAASLAATLTYTLSSPSTLEIRLRNDTTQAAPFEISMLYFNTFSELFYILILDAESSLEGENTGAWRFICSGEDIVSPDFGTFDHVLRNPPSATQAHRIAPGETQRFTFLVSCAGAPCDEQILADWSRGANSAVFAARFEDGPDGDVAFGAILVPVPEPSAFSLLALGLATLASTRRR
jgi:PEP-CTERM motif